MSNNKINYYVAVAKPALLGTDALWNEIKSLSNKFSGKLKSIFPFEKPTDLVPRNLYGLSEIFKTNKSDLTHVYAPFLHYFPFFNYSKKPIVYSLAVSLNGSKLRNVNRLKSIDKIVVNNLKDKEKLNNLGIFNVQILKPGIDLSYVKKQKIRDTSKQFTFLMASAPWINIHFKLKGIHLILEYLKQNKDVKFVFLWRGVLANEMKSLLKTYGVEDRVEFVNEKVDINEYLQKVDATILLSKRCDIVKAYPHSLLESLTAEKPVILSENIGMSEYVHHKSCGISIKEINYSSLDNAILELRRNYEFYQSNCINIAKDFSVDKWFNAYQAIYDNLLPTKRNTIKFSNKLNPEIQPKTKKTVSAV